MNANANLTYDGTTLDVNGAATIRTYFGACGNGNAPLYISGTTPTPVSGLVLSWNTIRAGQGNAEIYVGKGGGNGNLDIYTGITDSNIAVASNLTMSIAKGFVGINCNAPAYTLDVSGNAAVSTSIIGGNGYLGNLGANAATTFAILGFNASNQAGIYGRKGANNNYSGLDFVSMINAVSTTVMTVSPNSASVGIGTTAPAYTLDVAGMTRISTTGGAQLVLQGNDSTGGGNLAFTNIDRVAGNRWNISGPDSGYSLHIVNSGNTGVYIGNGQTSWSAQSDSRLKTIIEPISNATAAFEAITPVYYTLNSCPDGTRRIGVIAQEVLPHFPETISQDTKGMYAVRYTELIAPLITGFKELSARLSNVEARLAAVTATTTS